MKFKNTMFWSALITVLATLGVISIDDAGGVDLAENIVNVITYGGLVLSAVLAALGINNGDGDDSDDESESGS